MKILRLRSAKVSNATAQTAEHPCPHHPPPDRACWTTYLELADLVVGAYWWVKMNYIVVK